VPNRYAGVDVNSTSMPYTKDNGEDHGGGGKNTWYMSVRSGVTIGLSGATRVWGCDYKRPLTRRVQQQGQSLGEATENEDTSRGRAQEWLVEKDKGRRERDLGGRSSIAHASLSPWPCAAPHRLPLTRPCLMLGSPFFRQFFLRPFFNKKMASNKEHSAKKWRILCLQNAHTTRTTAERWCVRIASPLKMATLSDADAQWLAAAQSDPQLAGVATVAELHRRLLALSEALTRQDATAPGQLSVFQQLTFGGLHPNPVFEPNRFKPDVGTDGRKVTTYYR